MKLGLTGCFLLVDSGGVSLVSREEVGVQVILARCLAWQNAHFCSPGWEPDEGNEPLEKSGLIYWNRFGR